MNAKELREYIVNNDKLQYILEELGMHSINASQPKFISCGMPQGDNPTSTIVYRDVSLTVNAYTRTLPHGDGVKPNIFNLIMFIRGNTFHEAITWCHSILGLTNERVVASNSNYMDFYKEHKIKADIKKRTEEKMKDEQVYYDLSVLNEYSSTPHIELLRDGIVDEDILAKYMVMFDERSERIVFPHLKHDDKTKICGIVGRTVHKAYRELRINKYMSMLPTRYDKTLNLYGLALNIEEILKAGRVIVFEAEKSVIKLDQMGYPIGVSVGCHDISDFQVKLLMKLGVEIIIAFDNDVHETHLEHTCKKFAAYRMVSYIKDKWDILGEKDSPVDKGKKRWEYLFRHRNYVSI